MGNVRSALILEEDLGPAGWRTFHELKEVRGRSNATEILALMRYALFKAIQGEDVELTRSQLEGLLEGSGGVIAA
jgi:hypothetical protein